ncbi:hypothetical protein ACFV4P_34405 [Kitasatospora sp. NPDC059795]|uniref:hypothetical protein n=1 Tax=Kitasatospora sp. NPDC059795 TaxID=3346949 RepID=UPI0036689CEB
MATFSIVVVLALIAACAVKLGKIAVWQLVLGVAFGYVLAGTGAGPWIGNAITTVFNWVGHFKF